MAGGTYIVLRVSGDTPRSKDPFAEPVMRGEPGGRGPNPQRASPSR